MKQASNAKKQPNNSIRKIQRLESQLAKAKQELKDKESQYDELKKAHDGYRTTMVYWMQEAAKARNMYHENFVNNAKFKLLNHQARMNFMSIGVKVAQGLNLPFVQHDENWKFQKVDDGGDSWLRFLHDVNEENKN